MDEKKRIEVQFGPQPWTYKRLISGGSNETISGTSPPMQSVRTTVSRGHAWPSAGRGNTDSGGNFSTIGIKKLDLGRIASSSGKSGSDYAYNGIECAIDPSTAMNNALSYVSFSSDASLMSLGSKAIAQCIPTNPVADAGTFLGELKEGLPKLAGRELFKSKFKDYRKYGSEYLNLEFGWKPLVSDLQKFGEAAINSEKIIDQLHRDSGKNVRRRFAFPDTVVTTAGQGSNVLAATPGVSVYPYCFYSAGGSTRKTLITVTTKTWFSGCFTYHLNMGSTIPDKLARHAAEARKLYGIELTPATVWNLAPWSWAVDWEGNIGDVLHNVSRFSQDGLVMRYGYIMQTKTAQIDYTLAWGGRLNQSPKQDLTLSVVAESKIRRRATPFGFGFDMTALTGRQSAILGALGISRGPRHL